jgi:hypothetical protein
MASSAPAAPRRGPAAWAAKSTAAAWRWMHAERPLLLLLVLRLMLAAGCWLLAVLVAAINEHVTNSGSRAL